MVYAKLFYGYVMQSYDSETGDCVEQRFVTDGRVERTTETGEPIPEQDADELERTEKECALDMVQP